MDMPTDTERREVARRLRELEVCELDGEFIDCGEVEDTLGLVSDDGAWYEAQGVLHLAGLIDPDIYPDNPDKTRQGLSEPCDRDALLALAEVLSTPELETDCGTCPLRKWCEEARDSGNRITCFECKLWHTADVIREALGIEP